MTLSDGNVPIGTYTFVNKTGARQVGYGSYPNNIGTIFHNNGGMLDGPAYHIGTPAQGGTVTLASITDGLSNTFRPSATSSSSFSSACTGACSPSRR